MSSVEQLITENLDIWSSAIKTRSSAGRGGGKKLKLYGIEKLRELILDLAVRGLLVPQDASEESANVLLDNIATEKAEKNKITKNKKAKILPEVGVEFRNEDLPKGWSWALIPQIIADDKYSIKRGPFGSSIKKAYFVPSGYKVYEQQHAIKNDFSLGEYYVDDEKYQELSAFTVKPNDLIISCSGTVGKVAVAPEWMEPGIINQALLKISLNQNALINEYFKILFSAFYMKTETLNDLKGTAQKNMVSVDTLKKEPFPLPPYLEQSRIIAKVDELMALCDQLEQQQENSISAHKTLVETLLAALTNAGEKGEFNQAWARIAEHFDTLFTTDHSIDQLKQTILQLAVMGKLVPQNPNDELARVLLEKIAAEKDRLVKDKEIKKQKPLPPIEEDEKPFELPKGWTWAQCADTANPKTIITYGILKPVWVENGVSTVRIKDMKGGQIVLDDIVQCSAERAEKFTKTTLVENDLLIAKDGATLGKTAFVPPELAGGNVTQHVLRFSISDELCRGFVRLIIDSPIGQGWMSGETKGVALPGVNVGDFRRMPMALPPLNEQTKIIKKVDELMAICDDLIVHINNSRTTQLHLADAMAEKALS